MKQCGTIWFQVIVNGLKGLELPLSVEPDGFGDNMSPMECDVAAALVALLSTWERIRAGVKSIT